MQLILKFKSQAGTFRIDKPPAPGEPWFL
jgi:hypothetical protein